MLNNKLRQIFLLLTAMAIGWLIAWLMFKNTAMHSGSGAKQSEATERKPLYWVAPMDNSYRRDKPGKSPMGMDLVPVYADDKIDDEGLVTINPAVENNLGVKVATVRRSELPLKINTVGYVSFAENHLEHFHSRVSGWIDHLATHAEGDPVKQGQLLFDLYSPELVTAQEEYLAALNNNIGKNNILQQAAASKLSALGVSQAQIQALKKTRKIRQRLSFHAERDAYVAKLNVRHGMFIEPSTMIISLGDLQSVWVTAEIFERQAGWVEPGQRVDMQVSSFPGESWQGTVDYLYPVLDAKTRTLRARIVFDNKDLRLKPNMFAQLTIHAKPRKDTLSIPRQAVIRDANNSRVVKALGNGRYRSVIVKTGIETDDRLEILQGLQAGNKVVTSAQFLIDSESAISAELERMDNSMDRTVDEQTKKSTLESINTSQSEHQHSHHTHGDHLHD